jgi:hypothetical protein
MAVNACGDRSRGFGGVLVMHSGRVRVGVARERSGDRQFELQNHLFRGGQGCHAVDCMTGDSPFSTPGGSNSGTAARVALPRSLRTSQRALGSARGS